MRSFAYHSHLFLSFFIILLGIFLFSISFFSYYSVAYAWSTKQHVSVYCASHTVSFKVTFTNTEHLTSGKGMNVVAVDEQSGKFVDLGAVLPGRSAEGVIDTGLSKVGSGRVRFDLTWTSGHSGSDKRYVSYGAFHCVASTPEPTDCVSPPPTATPRSTVTPQPTVTPTVTPTFLPTPTPTVEPTIQPTITPTVQPTPVPTATPAVADITPTPSPRTDLSDGRSDGRQDALDCVPGSKYGRTSCNTESSSPVVAGISTRSLPSTGTGSEGSVFGVFSLFGVIFGVYTLFIAQLKYKKAVEEYHAQRKVIYVNLR